MDQTLREKLYYNRATVVRVIDADTLEVDIDLGHGIWVRHSKSSPNRIRLARVDAWETRGPERLEGIKAKERVIALMGIHGIEVLIRTLSKDSFGRWLAEVWLADGTNLGDLLMEEGHADLYEG